MMRTTLPSIQDLLPCIVDAFLLCKYAISKNFLPTAFALARIIRKTDAEPMKNNTKVTNATAVLESSDTVTVLRINGE
jgi:hypothetical protein